MKKYFIISFLFCWTVTGKNNRQGAGPTGGRKAGGLYYVYLEKCYIKINIKYISKYIYPEKAEYNSADNR